VLSIPIILIGFPFPTEIFANLCISFMIWVVNLNYMVISGWNKKYNQILSEFGYSKKADIESSKILNSKLGKKIRKNLIMT
jgi:hypothetical protein